MKRFPGDIECERVFLPLLERALHLDHLLGLWVVPEHRLGRLRGVALVELLSAGDDERGPVGQRPGHELEVEGGTLSRSPRIRLQAEDLHRHDLPGLVDAAGDHDLLVAVAPRHEAAGVAESLPGGGHRAPGSRNYDSTGAQNVINLSLNVVV